MIAGLPRWTPRRARPRRRRPAGGPRSRDAVAQARGVLVAQAVGEVPEPLAQARERPAVEEARELRLARAVESPGGALGAAPAPDRSEGAQAATRRRSSRRGSPLDALAVLAAGVGRRPELADEAQLLEPDRAIEDQRLGDRGEPVQDLGELRLVEVDPDVRRFAVPGMSTVTRSALSVRKLTSLINPTSVNLVRASSAAS